MVYSCHPRREYLHRFVGISLIQLKHDTKTTDKKAQHTSRDRFSSPGSTFTDGCVLNFLNSGAGFGIPDLKEQKSFCFAKYFSIFAQEWYQSLTIFGYISSICHLLSTDATKIIDIKALQSLVISVPSVICPQMPPKLLSLPLFFSCLDYCSSLLPGCLKHLLNNHKKIQNIAVHLVLRVPKTGHISPHQERERERERMSLYLCIIYACAHGWACAHVCGVGVCVWMCLLNFD